MKAEETQNYWFHISLDSEIDKIAATNYIHKFSSMMWQVATNQMSLLSVNKPHRLNVENTSWRNKDRWNWTNNVIKKAQRVGEDVKLWIEITNLEIEVESSRAIEVDTRRICNWLHQLKPWNLTGPEKALTLWRSCFFPTYKWLPLIGLVLCVHHINM